MDRRGFLKALGVGGALVVAAPEIVLAAATKVALPERRVFFPPAVGWRDWEQGETALSYLQFHDMNFAVLPPVPEKRISAIMGIPGTRWTADVVGYWDGRDGLADLGGPETGAGWSAWLTERSLTLSSDGPATLTRHWSGIGMPSKADQDRLFGPKPLQVSFNVRRDAVEPMFRL